MNRIYRLVFNRRLGLWQAVPETAKSCRKGGAHRAVGPALLLAGILLLPVCPALAGGAGGSGSAGARAGGAGGTGSDGTYADDINTHGAAGGAAGGGAGFAGGSAGVDGDDAAAGSRGGGGGGGGGGSNSVGGGAGGSADSGGGNGGNGGTLGGGPGGDGQDGATDAGGGAGGGGGDGRLLYPLVDATTGPMTGGAGGRGGNGSGGGGGGGGGAALVVFGPHVTVGHDAVGGAGGAGGDGSDPHGGAGGGGGGGGVGLVTVNRWTTIVVGSGVVVRGGAGGAGGAGRLTDTPSGDGGIGGSGGNGGAGIMGTDLTVINSGTIAGGAGGAGGAVEGSNGTPGTAGAAGNAITFIGGHNTLTVNAGGTLIGNIAIGGGGTLTFDQPTDFTVDDAITGDGRLIKTGAGTLTLTSGNTYTGGTTVQAGTLVQGEAGAFVGHTDYTVNGGTLDLFASDLTASSLSGSGGTISLGDYRLTVDQSGATAYAGTITGQGGLTKAGTGTLTLTGAHGYTGGTTVAGGTLVVDGSITGSAVTVHGGATLAGSGFVGSTTVQAGGRLAPGNSVGTLTVDGGLALAPGAFLDVELGGTGAAGAAPGVSDRIDVAGDLAFDGTVNLSQSGDAADGPAGIGYYRLITYSGDLLSNTATIGATPALAEVQYALQASSGRVDLFIDPAAVLGDDALQHWQGGDGTWGATSTQWLNAGGDTPAAWSGRHAVFKNEPGGFSGGTVAVEGAQTFESIQFVDGGYTLAGTGRLVTNAAGSEIRVLADSATIATRITGSGDIAKTEMGTLVLTGDSSGFAGTATVAAGTLAVNGRLGGSLDVGPAGRLQGTGTVGGTTVSGTVAPGNSIGTLDVGDITFNPGSTYEVEINAAGQSDRIAASGSATLAGGTVRVDSAPGSYALGTRYTLLTAAGGVTGGFDGVSGSDPFATPFLAFGLSYDANAAYLDVGRSDVTFASLGRTRNQAATGSGLDSLPIASPLLGALVQLDADAARAAFDPLSGEIHASMQTALVEDSRFVRNAANDRLRAAQAAPGAPAAGGAAAGAPAQMAAQPAAPGAWAHAFGAWGETDGDGNAARLDRDSSGLLIGADRRSGAWRVGALAGYGYTSVKAPGRNASGSSHNYHLGVYAGRTWDRLALRTGAAYTWHELQTRRNVAVPGYADRLSDDYRAGTLQAFGELAYGIAAGRARVEPFANLAHVRVRSGGYAEQGNAAALAGRADANVTFSTLGMRHEHQVEFGAVQATVRGMLGWRYAFGDTLPVATHRIQGGDAFTVAGAPIARNSAVVEAGLDVRLARRATLGLSYAGQIASGAQDHGVQANLSVRF